MASKSKQRPARKRAPNPLAELGLFDIPDLDAMGSGDDSDVDESTLESELEALLSGKAPSNPKRQKVKAAPVLDIEKMAAECLKETDDMEEEGDLSNDEDLLNELHTITEATERHKTPPPIPKRRESSGIVDSPPKVDDGSILNLLEERLAMYNEAIKAAKALGDNSKVRRYDRAVKTLQTLLKSAKSGASIDEEEIPPVVKIPTSSSNVPSKQVDSNHSSSPSPAQSHVETDNNVTDYQEPKLISPSKDLPNNSELITRRAQYKAAALQAKREGNRELALNYLKTVKTFDAVLEAIQNNLPVDLTNIPPAPNAVLELSTVEMKRDSQKVKQEMQASSDMEKAAMAAANEAEETDVFAAPPPPSTILEALQQRLEKYTATKQAAEAEGNSGKVRRLQRIIKQYETAIKNHKAGRQVDYEELPTPPGFAPIPVPSTNPATTNTSSPSSQTQEANAKPKLATEKASNPAAPPSAATAAKKHPKVQRANTTSVMDKQLEFLLERQKLFRQAALAAKKEDNIQQAKEYLRNAHGFDSLIEATKCGLPVDFSTIPTPPQLESDLDFLIVDVGECTIGDNNSQSDIFGNLVADLQRQVEVCTKNKDHFMRLGDVSSASKFERLCLESKKDLTLVLYLRKKGDPAPRFHYETRLFSIVQCHTDLGDNDIEVKIERGINLPGKPDDLDSYVKIEFPIPAEAPQRAKTLTVKDTNNPSFQAEFKFKFNRKLKAQLRQFKRQALKLEVWSKGGFLRSDTHIGTVNVKLVDLETKCSIHDSFDLMEGRRACGGKLEVIVRIRDPLLVKQVEEVREKWLVIGN